MADKKYYKAVNFDLDTNKLKEHFEHRSGVYSKIKNFMIKNGFEHRQYSGYKSLKPLDNTDSDVQNKTTGIHFTTLVPNASFFVF